MWARIENKTVMELTDIDPASRFHPSLIWVACPAGTTECMIYEGGQFHAPEVQPDE
jgi:hypothetical protein